MKGGKLTPVFLNVYDLHHANLYGYPVGLGAYHSGVEINGKEYAFGGHNYSFTGVFDIEPRSACGAIFRESVLLGETPLSGSEIQTIIDELSVEFVGNSYHPFSRNCNTFSNELSLRLFQTPIPGYVNRLPYLGSLFSCLIPPSGLEMLGLAPPSPLSASSEGSQSPHLTRPTSPTSSRNDFIAFSGMGSSLGALVNENGEIVQDPDENRREKFATAAYKRLSGSKGVAI